MHVLFGGPGGLTSAGSQYLLTSELFVDKAPYLHFRLTFGDFNLDGRSDLVMASADGPVGVLHGHPDGLHAAPLPRFPQPGEDGWWGAGVGEEGLGINVAAGDVTGDGNADVVVEWGRWSLGVILGTAAGLSTTSTKWEVPSAEYADIAILPFSGGSHAWLAVTHFPEVSYNPGSVSVLRGTAAGMPGPVTVWSQDSPGIRNRAERGDAFGAVIGG